MSLNYVLFLYLLEFCETHIHIGIVKAIIKKYVMIIIKKSFWTKIVQVIKF